MSKSPDSPLFFVTGGTLQCDAASYIARQADTVLLQNLLAGEFCYVLNSRQMGKSSLMVRTAERLKQEGRSVGVLDLQAIGQNLTPEQWYDGLLLGLGKQCGMEDELDDYWGDNSRLSPLQRFFEAIRQVVLDHLDKSLVIFVDEIDIVRTLPFSADEFFMGIRQCYVGRATNPDLRRLTFCLLGTATPAELIQDTRTSPFNVGKRVEVRDFSTEEAAPLARGLGENGQALLDRVLYWTGGHPYLTQRLCRACRENGASSRSSVDVICTDLFLKRTALETDDNLAFVRNRLLRSDVDLSSLLDLYARMLAGKSVPDDETNPRTTVLKLSGVARVEGGHLRVRNRIYEHVFDPTWVQAHMPDAELRRQRAAYRRGIIRATGLASLVVTVVGVLAVVAYFNFRTAVRQRNIARAVTVREAALRELAERELYVSDMSRASQALERGNCALAISILEAHIPGDVGRDVRGWEWRYLWARAQNGDFLKVLHLPGSGLRAMAASRDGRWRAYAMRDGLVYLTDIVRGNTRRIVAHEGPVNCVAFSRSNRLLATGGSDRTLRVWDVSTGIPAHEPLQHPAEISAIAFSPDGSRVVAGLNDLNRSALLEPPEIARLSTLWSWPVQSGGLSRPTILAGAGGVFCLSYSPDGKTLAIGCWDGSVRLLDSNTGQERQRLQTVLPTYDLRFSPNGQLLATGGNDAKLRLWKSKGARWELVGSPHRGPGAAIRALAFSEDSQRLAASGDDTIIRLWKISSLGDTVINEGLVQGHVHPIIGLSFLRGGKRLVSAGSDATVAESSAVPEHGVTTLQATGGGAGISVFSKPDGRTLAVTGPNNTKLLWDVQSRRPVHPSLHLINHPLTTLWSPDGRWFVTTTGTWVPERHLNDVTLWDARTFKPLATLRREYAIAGGCAFDPTGRLLATGHSDGYLRLWDTGARRVVAEQRLPRGHGINCLCFSPDGSKLGISDNDHVAVWDVRARKFTGRSYPNGGLILSITFSPDGRWIGTATYNGPVRFWDVDKGPEQKPIELAETAGTTGTLALAPDGRTLAVGYMDTTVRLWSLTVWPPQQVAVLHGSDDFFGGLDFSPDGKLLAGTCYDNTIRMWSTVVQQ